MKGSHSVRVREWIRKGSAHVFQLGSQTQLSRHLSPSFLEFTSFKLEGQSPGTCIFNRRKWSFVVGGEFWYNTVSLGHGLPPLLIKIIWGPLWSLAQLGLSSWQGRPGHESLHLLP